MPGQAANAGDSAFRQRATVPLPTFQAAAIAPAAYRLACRGLFALSLDSAEKLAAALGLRLASSQRMAGMLDLAKELKRRLSKEFHPDSSGSNERMKVANRCCDLLQEIIRANA